MPQAEFDHLEPALDVALGVGDDLAVLADESSSASSSMLRSTSSLNLNMTRARRCGLVAAQAGCAAIGGVDRLLEIGGGAEADLGLDLALVGVEHVALALAGSEAGTADEMVDAAKHLYAS